MPALKWIQRSISWRCGVTPPGNTTCGESINPSACIQPPYFLLFPRGLRCCGLRCLSFRRVHHRCPLAAFGGRGVERIQVHTFGGQFVEDLGQCASLVQQREFLGRCLLISNVGFVERSLCLLGIFGDELNGGGCPLRRRQQSHKIYFSSAQWPRDRGQRSWLVLDGDGELFGFGHGYSSCVWRGIIQE